MPRLARYSICGSRDGSPPLWRQEAEGLGTGLAARGMRLVYGAGDVGLMGAVARATHEAGGETFGVIPRHLEALEVGRRDLTAYAVTETMHERKKVMLMNSDAVLALPGGPGALDVPGADLAPARPACQARAPAECRRLPGPAAGADRAHCPQRLLQRRLPPQPRDPAHRPGPPRQVGDAARLAAPERSRR